MKALFNIVAVGGCIWAAVSSCSNVGCTENQNSLPLAGFYSMSTKQQITPDSVAVGGVDAPNDTLLLGPGSRVSQLYLPFRSTKPSTEFYFQYKQKALDFPWLIDTLRFDYVATPYFASEDCGAMYHYRITSYSYTTHLIDSVAVTDSLITNIDHETIQIYFRTAEEEEE
ncbi:MULTISPECIES: DUF6452 family protein [Duncaniella]|uniref:Lipoprotein n=2 Tax=Duncaniella TaxID=2518495 RepID=A0A4P7W2G3_9BACT|nr:MULTISPECIES: DUF6452 family protein [Duncaniella]MBJ2189897.1 hypothetical protein [Muribaculaceae bacterium]MCX4283966.1 DUF6452 family protein [Duncaniella dubosii]QCD41580.1 hypothetical protein E7747_04280 [Duncaniella dubosii]HBN63710.1 hypothetical protein [Porphyromonadaceae bacterium]